GAGVSGTVAVTATAAAAMGYHISSVQFFDGATSLGTVMSAPYTVNWDTTKVANGSHTLTAKATDNINGTATSAAVMVTVSGGMAVMSSAQVFPMTDSKASGLARIGVEPGSGALSGTVSLSGMSAQAV